MGETEREREREEREGGREGEREGDIGMDDVLAHYACTFKNSNLHFHFQ